MALSSVNSLFHSFLLCEDESDRLVEIYFFETPKNIIKSITFIFLYRILKRVVM